MAQPTSVRAPLCRQQRDRGAITQAQFDTIKPKALA
jgi:hypothetical protein